MHNLIIFGAGKGVGRLVLEKALKNHFSVVAIVRQSEQAEELKRLGVEVYEGDASDLDFLTGVMQQLDKDSTIISTIGGDNEFIAHQNIINLADQCAYKKMLMVTSLGCGQTWGLLQERTKTIIGKALRQKSLAEAWLQTSELDYCIIRPGGLSNKDETGRAQLFEQPTVIGMVTRADVAQTIINLLATDFNNKIYGLVDINLRRD